MKKIRLDKFLSDNNFGTRKHVKKMINSGIVTIDDKIVQDPSFSFNPLEAVVRYSGNVVEYNSDLYFILNKPKGYICSTIDELYPSVLRLLPDQYFKRLRIVGRLDFDTTGVLLLTNDGKLNNYLANPKTKLGKTYRVLLNHDIPLDLPELLKLPIDIGKGEYSSPAVLKIIEPNVALITLYEGKYHEVKRIFHHFHLDVIELDRVSFHNFTCQGLKPGEYRELDEDEISELLLAAHGDRKQR